MVIIITIIPSSSQAAKKVSFPSAQAMNAIPVPEGYKQIF